MIEIIVGFYTCEQNMFLYGKAVMFGQTINIFDRMI